MDRDAEKLMTQISGLIMQEGNYWHRILLSSLHHPASLKQVVYAGDKMMEDSVPVLVVAELPIEQRSGQIDLTFSIRRETPGRIVYTPVMILEIKSKTGLGFNLYSAQSRNKKKKEYGPKFHAWKKKLTDDEWKTLSNSRAPKDVSEQLDAYEKKLLSEYRRLVPSDSSPPEDLWKGVVVLDTNQSPLEVFDAFQNLLIDLRMAIANDVIDSSKLTAYIPNLGAAADTPRLTLLLSPSDGPSHLISEAVPLTTPTMEEDPFSERVKDERDLTVYISIPSATSSGNAASWISRNWHLLHHLKECEKTTSMNTEIHWLDLMGVFRCLESDEEDEGKECQLIRTRFGLDELVRKRKISRWTHRHLVDVVKKIKFVDLSLEIDQLIESNSSDLSSLLNALKQVRDVKPDTQKIVIVDGWSEFVDLISRERRHLVKHLERALLDILPVEDTNIIWIDSGVPHTRMNPHFQRKCIRPLPHDSHRRRHIDEIIYNVPSSPDSFGKLTSRMEDTRIIIQDTPTNVRPWVRSISVPQLSGFASKIRGTRRRDGIVSEDDVFRKSDLKPMYNRGVTLSGIIAKQTLEMIEEIEDHSVTLVPSVLRPRDEESVMKEEEQKEEKVQKPRSTVIEKVNSPAKSLSIVERMVLCPEEPPPVFSRSRYYDVGTITRGWAYDSFPMEPEEPSGPVRRPPLIVPTASSGIDTERSRELELRRLLYTAEFLMGEIPEYEGLYQVCEETVRICRNALENKTDAETLLISLKKVREIIFGESSVVSLWEKLNPIRTELIELLNSENRRSLTEVMDGNLNVLELYGNNLFLTICAVVEELVPVELKSSVACRLWPTVAEWIPYQLGFKPQKGAIQTKYDLQAIHSNLRHRTRTLLDIPSSVQESVTEEWGQFLWVEEDEGLFTVWIIFRDEKETVGGLLKGLREPAVSARWYECVIDPKEQRSASRQGMRSVNHTPLITQQYRESTILWILTESLEGQKVWVPFQLEYPDAKYRESTLVPWMKLSEVPLQVLTELQPPMYIEPPPYVKINADRFLESVITTTSEPIRVTCHVSIDVDEEVYVVDFYHKGEKIETLKFDDTQKLVRTLRHPIRVGTGLEISDGRLLIWDHKSDIKYLDVTVWKETISLSLLKTLVHRSKFFPDEFFIPKVCSELLSTREGDTLTLVIHSVDSSFKDLSVEVNGVPIDSPLRALEDLGLNIYDVALLTECKQLIDRKTMTRYSVDLDVKQLFDLRFRNIGDYSRLQSAIQELEVSDHDWTREEWMVDIFNPPQLGNQISWSIRSRASGRTWRKKVFDYEFDYALSIDEVITDFEEKVARIIPLKHISGFSDIITRLKSTLRSRGWGKGKPRCRVNLKLRGGEYVAVVSRIESGGLREIDSFPIDVMEDDSVLYDRLLLDGGLLAHYDVVNSEEFFDSVSKATTDGGVVEEESELDEEAELLQVIKEWREEKEHPLAQRYLGEALVKLADLHLAHNELFEALEVTEVGIGLLRECDTQNSGVRLALAIALIIKVEIFLRNKSVLDEVESLLQEAKELVSPLKLDISVQRVYDRIKRLTQ